MKYATLLISCTLLAFAFRSAPAADVIDDSLRLRLNFDAAPLNDVVVDSSPLAAHSGVNSNAVWVASEKGRNGVMTFKASVDNRISISAIPAFNATAGTISFWIKAAANSGPGEFAAILFDRRTTQGDVIALSDDGTIFVQARGGGQNVNSFASTKTVNDDQWHHIAYAYDQSAAGSISIYIDGVLDSTQANNASWSWPATQRIELGSSHDPFWRRFAGLMDDIQIHNRPLTEAEIAAEAAGNPVVDNSLVLRLNFDAAPGGNTIVDSSVSNASATNQGATWVASNPGHTGLMRFAPPTTSGITVPADPDFDATTGTIAFWMKSTGTFGPGEFAAMMFDRRTGVGDVITMKDDGTIFVQAQGSSGRANSFATAGKVNDGEWHHLAYVYDQSETGKITIYIDGAEAGSQANSGEWAWPTDQELELGFSHDSYWFRFDGALDDFRFYNRQLTIAEIGSIGVSPSLRFTLQPISQNVFVGDDVIFTSLANFPVAYQWNLGETTLAGATSTNLVLTNVQALNAGFYTVTASNNLGVATSRPAVLTVNPRPSLTASLVGRYNFDAAPANNVIVDSAPGGEHPGTNLLATWSANVAERSGVMQFSSADDGSQIVIDPHPDFDSIKGTIAFWVKTPGNGEFGDFGAILFDRRASNGDVIVMQDDGTLFVQAKSHDFNVNSFATTKTINDDQWHHVAYVYDQSANGYIRIYIDGQLAGSNPNSGAWVWDSSEPLKLGKASDTFWRRLDGYLDDVQFYNRTLSAAEVTQSMTLTTGELPVLAFSRSGNTLTVSWTQAGFVLEQNANLNNPGGWTALAGGGASPFALTVTSSGNNFYRLRKL